jgi:hypothetical protein
VKKSGKCLTRNRGFTRIVGNRDHRSSPLRGEYGGHEYRNRDFELASVALNGPDEEETVREFLKKEHASCKNFIFASNDKDKLIDAFKPSWKGVVPYSVLISPEGKIIDSQTGSIEPLELKRAIVKALNEKKPW